MVHISYSTLKVLQIKRKKKKKQKKYAEDTGFQFSRSAVSILKRHDPIGGSGLTFKYIQMGQCVPMLEMNDDA